MGVAGFSTAIDFLFLEDVRRGEPICQVVLVLKPDPTQVREKPNHRHSPNIKKSLPSFSNADFKHILDRSRFEGNGEWTKICALS